MVGRQLLTAHPEAVSSSFEQVHLDRTAGVAPELVQAERPLETDDLIIGTAGDEQRRRVRRSLVADDRRRVMA